MIAYWSFLKWGTHLEITGFYNQAVFEQELIVFTFVMKICGNGL